MKHSGCEDINEADSAADSRFRTQHLAAVAACGSNAVVKNLFGAAMYYCFCKPGYKKKKGELLGAVTKTQCEDIDECTEREQQAPGATKPKVLYNCDLPFLFLPE